MRSRKLAFNADSFEEFEKKYVSQICMPLSSKNIIPRRGHQTMSSRSSLHKEQLPSCSSPSSPSKRKNPWSDFDFVTSSKKLSFDEASDEFTSVSLDQAMPLKKLKCLVTKRLMVLGTAEAEKHSLIESIFGVEDGEVPHQPLKQSMDLIIKSESTDDYNIKYQFWMNDIHNKRFEEVVKVYYRCSSVFFFVYSIASKESFAALDEAIQRVLKEIPEKKFVGVLIGNKNEMEINREVSLVEGVSLKEKYGLKLFIEVDREDETLKSKFQDLVR